MSLTTDRVGAVDSGQGRGRSYPLHCLVPLHLRSQRAAPKMPNLACVGGTSIWALTGHFPEDCPSMLPPDNVMGPMRVYPEEQTVTGDTR
jgi:hypothetical protein